MLRASPPNAAPRDTTTEPTSTTPLHEALQRRARRFLTEGRRGGEALEDLAEEDLAAPLLLRRENSLGVAMASVSTPRSGRPPTPGTTPGTPGTPGAADGPSAPRFPSQQVDSPLSLGARGAWTSGPNAIIWSRDDADVDEEPRNVSDRGAVAASSPHRTAGVPARPPPPAKLYSLKRAWLMMNAAGETATLEATKMEMQRELGVPFRDLMILDPALPTAYPSSIFIRPRAIVVNMEHVKLVVTSGLVVSPLPTLDERRGDGDDAKFARRFTRRLKRQLAAGAARACEEDLEDLTLVPMHVPGDFSDRDDGRKGLDALDPSDRETLPADDEASRATRSRSSEKPHDKENKEKPPANDTTDLLGLRQTPCELRVLLLPFELRVVEAALHDVSGRLLDEAVALERDAAPALETLAERVSAASLEKTRGIKAAMNSLAARVGAAREALEKLLQDDADMAAMRLSRGDDEALHEDASDDDASKALLDDETGKDVLPGTDIRNEPNEQREVEGARSFSGPEEREETSTGLRSPVFDVTEKMTRKDDELLDSLAKASASASSASASSASRSGVSVSSAGAGAEAHEGVEALLEAYYMHCDYSFKRLNELRQAVEDTEDLAEIKLDSQRNQLIKVDLMLSNGALAVGAFSMVVGVFGMNLPTGLEASRDAFVEVLFVSAVACVALFVAVVVACRRWKLLQM